MKIKQLGLLITPGVRTDTGIIRGAIRYVQEFGGWEIATRYAVPSLPWSSLRRWKGQGLIAMVYHEDQYRALLKKGLPAVNASARIETPDLPTVVSDNQAVGRVAAEHLLSLGLRRFAAIGRRSLYHDRLRVDGFQQAICEQQLPCEQIKLSGTTREFSQPRAMRTLARSLNQLEHPVGVFTTHDHLGCLALKACQQLGIKVPYDMAVVGVNNYDLLCESAQPPLTSICQQAVRIGYEAARLLDRVVAGDVGCEEHLQVAPGELVQRRSTDFLAIDDPDVSAALTFIRDHGSEPITVDDVLGVVAVSRRTLDKKFLAALGHPPAEEIRCWRIRRAQELLARTSEQVVSVALRSGFRSVSGFDRAFRQHTGLTPRQYRRQFGHVRPGILRSDT